MLWLTKHYSIPTLYSSSLSSLSLWDSFIPTYSLSPSRFPHIQNHVVINQALFNFYPSILSQVSIETTFIPVSLNETIFYPKYPRSQSRQFSILAHRGSSFYSLSPSWFYSISTLYSSILFQVSVETVLSQYLLVRQTFIPSFPGLSWDSFYIGP